MNDVTDVNTEMNIDTLWSYSTGRLSRSEAMERCGFTWFGQLIHAMHIASIPMPAPSAEYTKKMTEDVINLLDEERE